MKAVFFDLDGTLVESLPGITTALNLTLEDLGHQALAQATVRTYIGDGLWMLIRRALPVERYSDDQITDLQHQFQQHYTNTWREGTAAFKGIGALLLDLAKADKTLGVLSNKPHAYTVEITEDLFGRELIPFIAGQKEHIPKKPDPTSLLQLCKQADVNPSNVIFVGDSTVDLETAINANIKVIGVSWGYHDAAELKKYKQPLADSVDELRALLNEY